MASVSELVDGISKALGEPRDKASKYARALIDTGMLPKSSGRSVAQVEIVHFVRLLTAIALQPKIKDTGERVAEYLELPLAARSSETGERTDRPILCEGMLIKVFSETLAGQESELAGAAIQFVTNFPLVEIESATPEVLASILPPSLHMRFKPRSVAMDMDDLAIRRSVIVWADLVKSMGFDLEGRK